MAWNITKTRFQMPTFCQTCISSLVKSGSVQPLSRKPQRPTVIAACKFVKTWCKSTCQLHLHTDLKASLWIGSKSKTLFKVGGRWASTHHFNQQYGILTCTTTIKPATDKGICQSLPCTIPNGDPRRPNVSLRSLEKIHVREAAIYLNWIELEW